MRIDTEIKLDFNDVLIRPKRSTLSSRNEVSIHRTMKFPHSSIIYEGVPFISSNMDTIGTFDMAKVLETYDASACLHKFYNVSELYEFFLHSKGIHFISTGIRDDDFRKIEILSEKMQIKALCIDVANGYQESFLVAVKRYRMLLPNTIIMAGNVVTGDMTEAIILAGADIVKVGIGSGHVCITRKMTGVGYPQLSAIIECSDAAHGLGGLVCADGGIRCPGDLVKAYAAGADFVMVGSVLGGHDEAAGELIEEAGKLYKKIYGMSSTIAQQKHYGNKPNYRASEGVERLVPYRGSVSSTLEEYFGGLRSALTYVGAKKLKELSKRTTFVRITGNTDNNSNIFI